MTPVHATAVAAVRSTQRDRLAALIRPIVEKIVDERLAELTAAELEDLREQWQAQPEADR